MRSSRRNSLIDGGNGLVVGGTGESMRGSRYVIAEELSKPQLDGRRNTTPPDFGRATSDGGHETEKSSSPQTDKPEKGLKFSRSGTLKRTMSLFKRKSLPPLSPDSTESRWSQSSPRSSTMSSFYKIARTTSLISFFGMTPSTRPVPPPKPPPPPVQPKETRPHSQSDPIRPPKAILERQAFNFPTRPFSSVACLGSSGSGNDDKGKIPAVRDLAILPTQRVMRFVLLYRDLLDNTPENSPTRPLVEKALEGAIRIADKCDRAQGNAAFLRRG